MIAIKEKTSSHKLSPSFRYWWTHLYLTW